MEGFLKLPDLFSAVKRNSPERKFLNLLREVTRNDSQVEILSIFGKREEKNQGDVHVLMQSVAERALPLAASLSGLTQTEIIESAADFVTEVISESFSKLERHKSTKGLATENLLSFSLPDNILPRTLRKEVESLQFRLRTAMITCATVIEMEQNENFSGAETASLGDRKNVAKNLRAGHIQLHVSYQALYNSIEIFKEVNTRLLLELEKSEVSRDAESVSRLMIINSIVSIELNSFIVDFLETFEIEGQSAIHAAKREVVSTVSEILEEDRAQKQEYHSGRLLLGEQTKSDLLIAIEEREDHCREILHAWEELSKQVDRITDDFYKFRDLVDTFEALKKNAQSQLRLLEVASVTRHIRSNINTANSALMSSKVELRPIDRKTFDLLVSVNGGKPPKAQRLETF